MKNIGKSGANLSTLAGFLEYIPFFFLIFQVTETDKLQDPACVEASKENSQSPNMGSGILKYRSRSQGKAVNKDMNKRIGDIAEFCLS